MSRKEETPEERAERKRRERENETPEQRAARKAKEAERESRHRKEETPDERAARKAKEAERDSRHRKEETPEERAERKRREKEGETPEQRAERKAREAERDNRSRKEETPEERAERKRKEREAETPEQRAERKAKEAERDSRAKKEETPEERAERKRRERESETPEQRNARKARERDEKDREGKREVVHKPLPQTLQKQKEHQHQAAVVTKPEPVVQARNPNLPPQSAKPAAAEEEYDDDDFVDGFEVEQMLEAQKAVIAENAAYKNKPAATHGTNGGSGTAAANRSMSPQPAATVVGHSRFGADDLQRQKYRAQFERDLARATALRRLVDLDDVSAVIADIPPLSEYDMYIRNFGGTGRKQMGNQAPPLEDKIDVEVQAERVAVKSKSGQCPEDLGLFPEKAAAIPTGDQAEDVSNNAAASKKGPTSVDATLLSSFLARVFPVMRTLLDEAHFGNGTSIKQSTVPFSSTYTTFQTKETVGRPVQRIAFNASAVQYVLCLHAPKKHRSAREDNRLPADRCDGLGVVWNVNDPTLPDKLLTHSCALTAACFSPTRPHLVYAGCSDGAVCIWDLRELDSAHTTDERISTVTLRVPSFTTEWQVDNHASPIVQLCVAGYNAVLGTRRDENDQLVTLDRNGTVYFWMVNDGSGGTATATAAGSSSPSRWGGGGAAGGGGGIAGQSSDQENGQLMASRVRCFRAATMTIGRPVRSEYAQASSPSHKFGNSCDIDFCPADASRFVVAAGSTMHHMSRFSSITAPSVYAPHSQFFGEAASAPSACSFSALDSRILISGYNDGTVRVYLKDEGLPQLSVPVSTVPIRQVRTSATIKLISFALDDNGTFYILDHGIEEKEVPVVQGGVGSSETGRCLCFGVPPEDKAVHQLMFGFEDGSAQLHVLNDKWLAPPASRSEKWL